MYWCQYENNAGYSKRLFFLIILIRNEIPNLVMISRPLFTTFPTSYCPVSWGCRIHRLLLCRWIRPPANECPGHDTKQSDGEVPAMLELWGMRSTPSSPSLTSSLWPGVVAPYKGPIYGLNRTKPCFFHYTEFCI